MIVGVGVLVGAMVGVGVGVFVGVTVGVGVGVFVGATVGVGVGVLVGATVGVGVGVFVGATVGVAVGVLVEAIVTVRIGVNSASITSVILGVEDVSVILLLWFLVLVGVVVVSSEVVGAVKTLTKNMIVMIIPPSPFLGLNLFLILSHIGGHTNKEHNKNNILFPTDEIKANANRRNSANQCHLDNFYINIVRF